MILEALESVGPLFPCADTLASKNAYWPVVHTPFALMSSQAVEDLLAVLGISLAQTSSQTSPRRLAIIF